MPVDPLCHITWCSSAIAPNVSFLSKFWGCIIVWLSISNFDCLPPSRQRRIIRQEDNLKTCFRISWKLWVHAWWFFLRILSNCLINKNSSACLKLITCIMMSPRKSQSCSSSALVIWSNSDHFWPACKYLKRIWVELIWFNVWIAFDQHGKSWMICWKLGSL